MIISVLNSWKNNFFDLALFFSRIKLNKPFKILHTLGLLHEHQRPDRDKYIDIDMAAVNTTGRFNQFKKAGFLEIEHEALNL